MYSIESNENKFSIGNSSMSKKQVDGAPGSARHNLLEALERLKRNEPTKAELILRANQGKLKINPSTVSMEAGRSRTLIGMPNCALSDVRAKVLEAEAASGVYKLRVKAIRDAKAEVEALKQSLQVSNTALASALIRISILEARLAEYEPTDKVTKMRGRRSPGPRQ